MPMLTIEMAYQMAEHFVHNIENRKYLWGAPDWEANKTKINEFQRALAINKCYNTWDYKFQTNKPNHLLNGNDKWGWFMNLRGFECFNENYRSLISGFSENYLLSNIAIKTCHSNGFIIRKI
jgi:hypothetical protein